MFDKIYLLRGQTGEYSDRQEFTILAFANEARARDELRSCEDDARMRSALHVSNAPRNYGQNRVWQWHGQNFPYEPDGIEFSIEEAQFIP